MSPPELKIQSGFSTAQQSEIWTVKVLGASGLPLGRITLAEAKRRISDGTARNTTDSWRKRIKSIQLSPKTEGGFDVKHRAGEEQLGSATIPTIGYDRATEGYVSVQIPVVRKLRTPHHAAIGLSRPQGK